MHKAENNVVTVLTHLVQRREDSTERASGFQPHYSRGWPGLK